MVWDYVSGGIGDEVTVRANRAAFARCRFLPRVLRGIAEVSTATTILGQAITLPVLIAPSGRHRLCHDEGERATARAGADMGRGMKIALSRANSATVFIASVVA